MINKTYRVFLASSSMLKEERTEIEKEISRLNDKFIKRRTYLELVIWEKLDSSVSETRKQDDYIRELRSCDILLLVYWGELGKFTHEEYKTAYQLFLESGGQIPRIYIHKKEGTANWNPEADNEENLHILEGVLKQQDKEQWPRLFENKDALTKNIKETIENLFDHSVYDHFTYGDKVPYNETSGNEGFVIRDNSLLKARNLLADKRKVLYIHGISGSGKTKLVENLLHDIARPGNTVWIDCAESNPTPVEIAAKLHKVIDFAHISPERKTQIQQRLAPDSREDINKLNNEVLIDLGNQLQSATLDDLHHWFPKETFENRPVYLVLDDYDNLISEDGRAHWLAGNFVEKCLQHAYSPRIIIIFKYPENEENDKTRRYLQHTSDILKTNAPLKINEIELRYLSDDETEEFYAGRDTKITQKKWLSEARSQKDSWMPVQLQLLADVFEKKITESDFHRVKQVLIDNSDNDTHLINELCRFLFERIRKEANGDDLILVGFASSILQKYNAGHRAIDKAALQFMLADRYKSVDAVNAVLSTLCTLNVLKNFHDPGSSPYKEFSFQHDTKLNFCFNELPASGLSQNVHADKKEFYHFRAADFYSNAFENEKDESLKVRYGEFAVWNYSQLVKPKGKKMRLLKALPILNKIDRELRTSFNYKVLNELRRGVVPDLNDRFSQEERTPYFINHDHLEEQASNLADLAEIYFQGLDQWDEAKNITLDVYNQLKNNVFIKGTNNAIDAFLQAAHLAAILSFETFLNKEEFENNFNTEQEYSDISGKYKLWCIRLIEIILKKYLHIPVREIYEDKRKYPGDDLHDRAIIANMACSLGVFLNRSEKYEHAVRIYQFAVRIIDTLVNEIDTAANKKVSQCDNRLNQATLPEEKAHWQEQKAYWLGRGEAWREYIDKDLMCIHSNLSRTILLMTGVDEAIAYFNNNLSTWFGTQPKRINPHHSYSSGQEYNYAVINICYYHFCKGEVREAMKWLDKSQDIPGEEWLKASNEQMRLVLCSYDPEVIDKEEVMKNFEDNCLLFKERIGDSRAVLFSEFNRTALNIALQLEEAGLYGDAPDPAELNKIFTHLQDLRKRADEKEYFLASKVISYTHNHFLKLLQDSFKDASERAYLAPHSKWKSTWENEVLNHLNGIMTCNSPDVSFSPWRPPMLMAGILLMRSKPFSPSDTELDEFRLLEIKDYIPA